MATKSSQSSDSMGWWTLGLGVKRWLLIGLISLVMLALAIAFVLVEIYQGGWLPLPIYAISLNWLPRWVRAVMLSGIGIPLAIYSLYRINQDIVQPFMPTDRSPTSVLVAHKRRNRGPKIVVIGGGTGMSTLLRGLKTYTSNITAIVTVADDGGSSGRLRQHMGVLPPGDFRNCIAALADDEALTTQLFQYRFGGKDDIGGHSFGNLYITAMSGVAGSFENALIESSKVLAIQGQVIPSTLDHVTLCAEIRDSGSNKVTVVHGESKIPKVAGKISRVYLEPDDITAYPLAVQSILQADLVVAGPGSLYTSILPNLLVDDLVQALTATKAPVVYVCNVASQPGETDEYSIEQHVRVLENHTKQGMFSKVLANNAQTGELPDNLVWITSDLSNDYVLDFADVIDNDRPWRHDSEKLAAAIMELLN